MDRSPGRALAYTATLMSEPSIPAFHLLCTNEPKSACNLDINVFPAKSPHNALGKAYVGMPKPAWHISCDIDISREMSTNTLENGNSKIFKDFDREMQWYNCTSKEIVYSKAHK